MFNKIASPATKQESLSQGSYVPRMTLTVDELAEEFHISRPTAYELVKQQGFPSFTIGHRLLVNRAGLQRWMDEKCAEKSA